MNMREITESYSVSPQIDPADMADIAAAGVTLIIDNRPDAEIPPSHHGLVMAEAAKAAGIEFVHLPITHDTMTPDVIATQQAKIAGAEGKVVAYCASGTRSTVIWALGQAGTGDASVDQIIGAAARGGYDLAGLRPRLEALAKR